MKSRLILLIIIAFAFCSEIVAQQTICGEKMCWVKNYSEYQAREYFDNATDLDPIEGIWIWNGFKISIEKDYYGNSRNPNAYRAVIIGLPSRTILEIGDISFFLEKGAAPGVFSSIYFIIRASWSGGKRNYNMEAFSCVSILNGPVSLASETPTFDDYGNNTGYETRSYVKIYPQYTENRVTLPSNKDEPTEWSGSGFALNQGHVVTNYHVVEDANTILIKGVKGDFQTELKAKVVATDKVNDIAILQIDDERFKGFGTIPYKIKRSMSDVGESVWTLGYPMTDVMGEEVKFTDGKISSRTGIQGDVSIYQISVPIQPGNSGGALFDDNGNVVGITSSGLNREAFNSENVNYAIKTSYLYNLIESSSTSSIIPQGTAMQGQTLTQKISMAKNFVFLIKCSTKKDSNETIATKEIHNDSNISANDEVLYFDDVSIETNQFIWELIKIKLTSNNTIITKRVIPKISSAWVQNSKNEFIEDAKTGKRYYITGSSIGLFPEKTTIGSSITTFAETYPALPDNVTIINISSGSSYYIKNYKIR